jgi:hypothetical protein
MSLHPSQTSIISQVPFCAVVYSHDAQKGKGRMSFISYDLLVRAKQQPDCQRLLHCASRFTTAGVLLSTTANHKEQQERKKQP